MAPGTLAEDKTGDCNIYVGSQRSGQRVMAELTAFLEQRLRRKVNASKSAVARPWQRKFLGYSVTWRKPNLKIAPTSRQRLTEKIRQTLRGARGQSAKQVIAALNPILRGWVAYFRLTEGKVCWRNSMAGSGARYERYYGDTGSAVTHGRKI